VIYLRACPEGGAELVAHIGTETHIHRLDQAALLALIEMASRIALISHRDERNE
jgi:hypothetical protein